MCACSAHGNDSSGGLSANGAAHAASAGGGSRGGANVCSESELNALRKAPPSPAGSPHASSVANGVARASAHQRAASAVCASVSPSAYAANELPMSPKMSARSSNLRPYPPVACA